MRIWMLGLIVMVALGVGGVEAAEQNALPAFDLVSPTGAVVTSAALSPPGRWMLIYVSTACGSCDRLLDALEQWRPTLTPGRIVVVISGAREGARAYAAQHANAAGLPWYADVDHTAARALGLEHQPALVAIENGRVAWTVNGVLNDPQVVEPIIKNWTVR